METYSKKAAKDIVGKNLFSEFPELPENWLKKKISNIYILKNFSFTSWEQRPFIFKFPHNRAVTSSIECMRQDCALIPVKNADGEVDSICFTLFDVTDTSIYQTMLMNVMKELEETSHRDGLTNIYNRRFLEENLSKEFTRAMRYSGKLSIILLDIDFFKNVNDEYGHVAGDLVLCEVANRLHECLRNPDIVGRYGGEEFLVVLPETEITGAQKLAERLRKIICCAPVICNDTRIQVTVSLGVTELRMDTEDYRQFVNEADRALYQSKANGRDQVTTYAKP